jgi:hypothetical protein
MITITDYGIRKSVQYLQYNELKKGVQFSTADYCGRYFELKNCEWS